MSINDIDTDDQQRYPIELCRSCRHPTDECRCPHSTEAVIVVPDQEAAAVRRYLRDHPELRKGEYRDEHTDTDSLLGLCYPAAEAYYHLRGCTHDIYCLSWSDIDPEFSGTHWYLRESGEGQFIDLGLPARPQRSLPPFEQGTRRGFITGDDPSKRARQVLDGV